MISNEPVVACDRPENITVKISEITEILCKANGESVALLSHLIGENTANISKVDMSASSLTEAVDVVERLAADVTGRLNEIAIIIGVR